MASLTLSILLHPGERYHTVDTDSLKEDWLQIQDKLDICPS